MRHLAEFFKALGDENRLQIIKMITHKEQCVCELMVHLAMSQPAVSHHLKILRQAGIVKDRREGKWIFYSLDRDAFLQLETQFEEVFAQPIRQNKDQTQGDCLVCENLREKLNFTKD